MPNSKMNPVLASSRREAIFVACVWLSALVYTIAYCSLEGYGRRLEEIRFVAGVPDWIFWGIVLPWSASTLVSVYFAYGFMKDEELGADLAEGQRDD